MLQATLMADLVNTFCWSISARGDFEECPRRRYWSKYAMWNGWQAAAPALARTAYRLSKMENRFSLQGRAVERAVTWALGEARAGRTVTVGEAYEAAARPFLNACWSESKKKLYLARPKQCCCLHEHYYPAHHHTPEPEMTARMMERVKAALGHFLSSVLPRLAEIAPDQELPVARAGAGDPESFEFEAVKVYAIPDFVWRRGESVQIHDWKAGRPQAAHGDQMRVYGLWAHTKYRVPAEAIAVHLEYLAAGETRSATLTGADLEQARVLIRESVADMAGYLVQADLRRNQPLPKEDWELSAAHLDVSR